MREENSHPESSGYAHSQGTRLLTQVVEAVGPIFTIEDARMVADDAAVPLDAVPRVLHQLANSTWVVRLKRGVYAVQTPLLDVELHPYAVAVALVSPAAISHWSALAHHGLTTQIPPMVQSATPQMVVTPEMRSGEAYSPRGRPVWRVLGMEFEYIQVQARCFFGHDQEWVDRWHRIAITDRERTLLDMVAAPGVFGSLQVAIETLDTYRENVDLEKLIRYTLRYDVGAIVKRVGWILETLGVPESTLQPLLDYPTTAYSLLDLTGPSEGAADARWRIYNNLQTG